MRDYTNNAYMIPHHLALRANVDHEVVRFNETRAESESHLLWARTETKPELRPDTTEYVSESFGRAVWNLIHSFAL